MEYRQLGKEGPKIPVLGLGAWPIGGGMGYVDEQSAISIVHSSINSGITLVDTAQGYRTSEATLGKALKNGYRDRCFLATKVSGNYSPQAIRAAIENSLRALDTDFVDLYQIHSWDARYPIGDSMDTLARLQAEGKTRYIGVSNFTAEHMRQALQTARFQANQLCYNLFDREIEQQDIPFCEREHIGILAHSPLAKGLLAGKYTPDWKFAADDERSGFPRFQGATFARYLNVAENLKEVARAKRLTLVQLAIAWILRQPSVACVLVGAKTPRQVEDYLAGVGVTFSADEAAHIDTLLSSAP